MKIFSEGATGWEGNSPALFSSCPFPVRKALSSVVKTQNSACDYLENQLKGHCLCPLV